MVASFNTISVLIALLFVNHISCGSIKKKTPEDILSSTVELSNLTEDVEEEIPTLSKKKNTSPPAIVAIEIVDEDDNSTDARPQTKRTIESNLGYGYQGGFYNTMKKFMIYPYSQKDIPPAPVTPPPKYTPAHQQSTPSVQVQKAITYNLGTRIEYEQPKYPATLYSTINSNGQLNSLSTHFPVSHQQGQSVPVIILRLYTHQLADPNHGVYPALPANNPYSYINRINIQDIVARYLQQHLVQHQQQPIYQHSLPVQQPQQQYQPIYHTQYTEKTPDPADDLPTHENYPDDAHTRVIYHSPRGHFRNGANFAAYNRNYLPLIGTEKVQHEEYKDIGGLRPPVVQNTYITQKNEQPEQQYQYVYQQPQIQQPQIQQTQYQQNTIYTDKNGQNYIYVLPSQLRAYQQQQLQQQQLHQQQLQQQQLQQLQQQLQQQQLQQQQLQQQQPQQQIHHAEGDYDTQNQVYYQPEDSSTHTAYQVQDESEHTQTEPPFNYHAHQIKRLRGIRNKKNSGSPVTFSESRRSKSRKDSS